MKDPGFQMFVFVINLNPDLSYSISLLFEETHEILRYRTQKIKVSICWFIQLIRIRIFHIPYQCYMCDRIESLVTKHKGSGFPDVGKCNQCESRDIISHINGILEFKYSLSWPNTKDPGFQMLAYVSIWIQVIHIPYQCLRPRDVAPWSSRLARLVRRGRAWPAAQYMCWYRMDYSQVGRRHRTNHEIDRRRQLP